MSIFNTLKKLIETNLNIKINNFSFININIVRGKESKPVTPNKGENSYTIDLEKLNKKEYKQIKLGCKEFVKKDKLLLENKSSFLLSLFIYMV